MGEKQGEGNGRAKRDRDGEVDGRGSSSKSSSCVVERRGEGCQKGHGGMCV